jgi:hypothetical protein
VRPFNTLLRAQEWAKYHSQTARLTVLVSVRGQIRRVSFDGNPYRMIQHQIHQTQEKPR